MIYEKTLGSTVVKKNPKAIVFLIQLIKLSFCKYRMTVLDWRLYYVSKTT
ncbi:hypothetical protein BTH160X_50045 [Brochothrix thermosphacta]|nr:hypothetical protein BTH160X_50045 [Brochothrix thermosphacta]